MKFSTWKTITLGTGLKTGDDFINALKLAGFNIGQTETENLLRGLACTVAGEEIKVALVSVSIHQLGLYDREDNGAVRCDDLYCRARDLGLGICPAEVGPQLRLQYPNQPRVENARLIVGMEPIITKPGPSWKREERIFTLSSNNKGLWLITNLANPGTLFYADTDRFLFLKTRKESTVKN
jgi:hypothetical protein